MASPQSIKISENLKLNSDKAKRITYLHRHFIYFACIASLNHALTYVVTAFASSIISSKLSSTILGLSWSLNAVSGLTVATPVVKALGWKYAMIISLAGYTIQLISFLVAILRPDVAWPVAVIGSTISGFTSAIWWTAEGVCFELTCSKIHDNRVLSSKSDADLESDLNDIAANLSAYWTVIYQVADIIVFVSLTICPVYLGIPITSAMAGLCVLGGITTVLGFTFDPLGQEQTKPTLKEVKEGIAAVPKQFVNDARVSLLAPFVFGFGITTAMFAYYVNDSVISANLGQVYIGLLEAFTYLVATISAFPYAYISVNYSGGRHFVMQFGSLMFLLSGLVVLCSSMEQLSSWTLIFVVKGLYGLGRGVFEGACRAVYASLFKGDDLAAAFSSQTLLAGFSGGLCFFLYRVMTKNEIAGITVANGILALVAYGLLWSHPKIQSPIPWSQLFNRSQAEYTNVLDKPLFENYEATSEDFTHTTRRLSSTLMTSRHSGAW